MTNGSPFSAGLLEKIRVGKYSRWAEDLTEEGLLVLLWCVGEFGYRAVDLLDDPASQAIAELRDADRGHSGRPYAGDSRTEGALRVLARLVNGEAVTMDQAKNIILAGMFGRPR